MIQREKKIGHEKGNASRLGTSREAAPTGTTHNGGKGQSAPDYKGPLAVPVRQLGLLDSLSTKAVQEFNSAKYDTLMLLLEHFGIDPADESRWSKLALALAEKHVPGFQPPPKPQGRPKETLNIAELAGRLAARRRF
jgi:hypothetical protein